MIKPECAAGLLHPMQIEWLHLIVSLGASCLQHIEMGSDGTLGVSCPCSELRLA